MNEKELKARLYATIEADSIRISKLLAEVLLKDCAVKAGIVPGNITRLAHNLAAFHLIAAINCNLKIKKHSETDQKRYVKHVDSLKPAFLGLCGLLDEFDPKARKTQK